MTTVIIDQVEQAIKVLAHVKPPYVKTYQDFQPGKTFVQYSGQWWDEDEMEMALTALVKGSWVTSGDLS